MTEERKDIQAEEVTEEKKEQVDTQQEEKVVTVAEMQRRLKKKDEAIEEAKLEAKRLAEEAIENFKKESQMNADELADYKLKEAERKANEERERLNAIIEEYKQKEQKANIQNVAINKLGELNIATNEETLKLVTSENIDTTAERIDILNKLLMQERNKYIGQDAPNTSGGYSMTSNDADIDNMTELIKQKLNK